jgi:hypothetical protein
MRSEIVACSLGEQRLTTLVVEGKVVTGKLLTCGCGWPERLGDRIVGLPAAGQFETWAEAGAALDAHHAETSQP